MNIYVTCESAITLGNILQINSPGGNISNSVRDHPFLSLTRSTGHHPISQSWIWVNNVESSLARNPRLLYLSFIAPSSCGIYLGRMALSTYLRLSHCQYTTRHFYQQMTTICLLWKGSAIKCKPVICLDLLYWMDIDWALYYTTTLVAATYLCSLFRHDGPTAECWP